MVKKWLRVILTSVCMMIGMNAFAYVDDAGIMGQFNYDNSMNMWQYLNDNGFQFKPDRYRHNPGVDGYMKTITVCSSLLLIKIDSISCNQGSWLK